MNGLILIVLIAFVAITQASSDPSDCEIDNSIVKCTYMSDGIALDRMLQSGTIKQGATGRVSVTEIAPRARQLVLVRPKRPGVIPRLETMSIRHNTLAIWKNLTSFTAVGPSNIYSTTIVDVPAGEFVALSRLTSIKVCDVTLSENALKAIESVGDRLKVFYSAVISPSSSKIVHLVTNMTTLNSLTLHRCDSIFPSLTMRKSASTLDAVDIVDCPIRVITREMFRGMQNLRSLHMYGCSTESVEEGAFDDLINAEEIAIEAHSIRRLPHGLFGKMKKLKVFNMRSGSAGIENVSRQNFTHVENFQSFQLVV